MQKRKTHYRVLRSTVVLALASRALQEVATDTLRADIAEVQQKNYQFDQIEPAVQERLFVAFDAAFTDRVRSEFTFFPKTGSVRVHDSAVAICALCGKGDSKETGDNRDHLRIEYLLANTAGGEDTWCGSTCIINYGLKVDGAATADEALRLLQVSMRQALRQWEINTWRAQHGDHAQIPQHYEQLRNRVSRAHSYVRHHYAELLLLGIDPRQLLRSLNVRELRNASSFYLREGYLTPRKMPAWESAKRTLRQIDYAGAALSGALDLRDPNARINHFLTLGDNNEVATQTPTP